MNWFIFYGQTSDGAMQCVILQDTNKFLVNSEHKDGAGLFIHCL